MNVSELSDKDLNRLIETEVMGQRRLVDDNGWKIWPPDYCNSLDAVAKAEAKVIGHQGAIVYGLALKDIVERDLSGYASVGQLVTATARQRAIAVILAAGVENDEN